MMFEDGRTGHGAPGAWAIHSDDTAETYVKILNSVDNYFKGAFTPVVLILDCCDKELSGFKASNWAKRGTMVGLCYFHFKR